MIMYTPIGFKKEEFRNDPSKRMDIHKNKTAILQLAEKSNEPFFIMRDLDTLYESGIQDMQKFLEHNTDYGAVALWPHPGEPKRTHHLSTAFIMVRSIAVKGFNEDFGPGCFCNRLCKHFRKNGWEYKYIEGTARETKVGTLTQAA